jgi:hypothetical protein
MSHLSPTLQNNGLRWFCSQLRASNAAALFPPLYKNGVEGVVTQLRPSTSHILMWGVREQEGHPLYPMTALP